MKKLLLGALGLLALVVIGLAAWLATLDVNRYKPRLVAAVEQATGRDFDIAGDLALVPSLVPTLSVEGVRLGNAPWAAHETMLSAERFELVVGLLPLLRRTLQVERIVLGGVRVSLESDRRGRGNWVMPLASAEPGPSDAQALPAFDLREFRLDDVIVEYRAHEREPRVVELHRLALDTRNAASEPTLSVAATFDGQPLSVEGTLAPLARLLRDEPYALDLVLSSGGARVHATGTVAQPLSVRGLAFDIDGTAPDLAALPGLGEAGLPGDLALGLRGTVRAADPDTVAFEKLVLTLGDSELALDATLRRAGRRPALALTLEGAVLDLTPFAGEAEDSAAPDRVFSAEPLPLAALAAFDLEADVRLGRLVTRAATLETVAARVTIDDGSLAVEDFAAVFEGGTLAGELSLSAGEQPRLRHRLVARGVALAPWLNRGGERVAKGGRADFDLQVDGRGRSPAEIAGSADGRIGLDVRDLVLEGDQAALAAADLFVSLMDLMNPLSQGDSGTQVECAVLAFPIEGGRLVSETGVGIRTRRLSILGGGVVDLRTETLDIGVSPKPREGIGLNAASIADFVRLGGTLSAPRAVTDAKGVATASVKVGAALATGGLSLVAEGLFDRAGADVDACAVARGEAALPAAADGGATSEKPSVIEKTGEALESAGSKVKDAFKSLFGN